METRNGFHYCYGEKEWFSQLLWRQGMVFTTAMEKRNGFHNCYGDNESFSLLLWRRGMVYTTAMEKRNGFHNCYGDCSPSRSGTPVPYASTHVTWIQTPWRIKLEVESVE